MRLQYSLIIIIIISLTHIFRNILRPIWCDFNTSVFSTPNNNSVVATLSHLLSCNSSHNRHCRNPNHHTSVFFTCPLTTDKFPEITKKDQRQHPKMQPLVCKPFIYGIPATFLFSSCHQHDSLNMGCENTMNVKPPIFRGSLVTGNISTAILPICP